MLVSDANGDTRMASGVRKPKAFEGQRHGILIADLHPQYNIRTSVEAYTSSTDLLKSISSDRIFQVLREERWLGPDDMPDLVKEIRESGKEKLFGLELNANILFHAGPYILPRDNRSSICQHVFGHAVSAYAARGLCRLGTLTSR